MAFLKRFLLESEEGRTVWSTVALFVVPVIFGFWVACVGFAYIHPAVEAGQVLSGQVSYPPENVYGQYSRGVFTLLHPVMALGLKAGMTERLLHFFLSGLLGAVNYLACALLVFAFCRRLWLSVWIPPLVHLASWWAYPVTYGLGWMSDFTYGILGLGVLGLVAGLWGSGFRRAAMVLLGLSPAIHPSLSVHLHLLFAVGYLSVTAPSSWFKRDTLREWIPYGIGLVVTAVFAGIFLYFKRTPTVTSTDVPAIMAVFSKLWDCHRLPIQESLTDAMVQLLGIRPEKGMAHVGMMACVWIVPMVLLHLLPQFKGLSRDQRFVLFFFLFSAVLAWFAVPISRLPPEKVPVYLWMLMPQRWVNVPIFFGGALATGLLASSSRTVTGRLVLSLWFLLIFLNAGSALYVILPSFGDRVPEWMRPSPQSLFPLSLLLSLALWSCPLVWKRMGWSAPRWMHPSLQFMLLGLILVFASVLEVHRAVSQWPDSLARTRDFHRDGFWQWVHRQPGLVVGAADMGRIQARSGRPILLEPVALDTLSMTPSSGPEMKRVLADVYEIDMFHPPPEALHTAMIPTSHNRRVFEARTPERWAELARKFGFMTVITPEGWQLHLEVGARSDSSIAWRLP